MNDRMVRDATKMVGVVDELVAWILASRPDLVDDPVLVYVRKHNDRLRESTHPEFDLDESMRDSKIRGRLGSGPQPSDVAGLRANSHQRRLAEVYYQHSEGMTAPEAALVAGLKLSGDVFAHIQALLDMKALKPSGGSRVFEENGESYPVLHMTLAARDAWRSKHGELPPVEVLSIFGDDVEVVQQE